MTVDTGAFIAGVGVLVALDLAVLGVAVSNARRVGRDSRAREWAKEAEEQAQAAHERFTRHLRRAHDRDVQTARESLKGGPGE